MYFILYTFDCILLLFDAKIGHVTVSLGYVQPLSFSLYWFVYQEFVWRVQNALFFSVPLYQAIDQGRTHYSDVALSVMACQITRGFIQLFVWANIKENNKDRVADLLWEETTGDLWIPSQKGQ